MTELFLNMNPTIEEAEFIADNLKPAEFGLMRSVGVTPSDICLRAIKESEYVYTINRDDGTPISLVGAAPLLFDKNTAIIWSMSTKEVNRTPIAFVKVIKKLIQEYCGLFSRIVSYAHEDNPQHKKFHLALGLVPTDKKLTRPDGTVYRMFEIDTVKGLNEMYYAK